MRSGIAILLALAALLGGCKREPTFEERYDNASKAIVERAKRIDAQIAGSAPAEDEALDRDAEKTRH